MHGHTPYVLRHSLIWFNQLISKFSETHLSLLLKHWMEFQMYNIEPGLLMGDWDPNRVPHAYVSKPFCEHT